MQYWTIPYVRFKDFCISGLYRLLEHFVIKLYSEIKFGLFPVQSFSHYDWSILGQNPPKQYPSGQPPPPPTKPPEQKSRRTKPPVKNHR